MAAEQAQRLTLRQLALECDVAPAYVEDLVEQGVLRPAEDTFDWVDIYRVRAIRALEDAGLPLRRLAPAFSDGPLSLDFVAHLMPPPSPMSGRTFSQFVASLGERGPRVPEVYEMLGMARPPDDKAMREDEESAIREFVAVWGDDPEILKRAARVAGYSIRLVVEGWTGLHYEHYRTLGGGAREAWTPELRAYESVMAGRALRLAESIPAWLTARLYEQVLYSDIIENIKMQIDPFEERDPARPGVRQPAVVFVDLSGFTAMTDAEGDRVASATIVRFEEEVSRAALRHGGRVVKLLGDGAMLRFPEAGAAGAAAVGVREALADLPLGPRAGIDCGPLAERDGDVFGRTVNMASRLASAATDGQILLSAAAARAAERAGFRSKQVGELRLKGLDRAVLAYTPEAPERSR